MTDKKTGRRGGKREGAGRKRVAHPKVTLGVRVSQEAFDKVNALAEQSGKSRADVVDTAIRKLKNA